MSPSENTQNKIPRAWKASALTEDLRKVTAFHESGHAVLSLYTDGALPVESISIQSEGTADDKVTQEDVMRRSRKEILAALDVLMGGRVAEELMFGENEVTSRAAYDIKQATITARIMVTQFGMSKTIGPVFHNYEAAWLSTESRFIIEKEVKRFIEVAYIHAEMVLKSHVKELKLIANALFERETLSESQIKYLINSQQ